MASSSSSYCQRPTLPPLRELNLPMPEARTFPLSSTSSYSHLHHPTPFRPRQVSISSSVTSSSPSPPPFGMKSASPYLSPTETLHTRLTSGHKVRLVPCSLEEAEAVVFVPPPLPHALSRASENIDPRQSPHQQHGSKPQALFLIGSMIERHLRHPSRVISKGARIHPYRAVREGENTPKRMSLNRRATANAEA